MPTDRDRQQPQRRCPICWTPFTPNNATNPNPRRYCSPACRVEDWRRRADQLRTQTPGTGTTPAQPDTP
jgi:endogenous inhibitor of DNA gyrase (YacG/DUF329 family)